VARKGLRIKGREKGWERKEGKGESYAVFSRVGTCGHNDLVVY